MADTNSRNRSGDLRPEPNNDIENTRDPEFEIPDPEQVERDREEAERIYNDQPKKKPAA